MMAHVLHTGLLALLASVGMAAAEPQGFATPEAAAAALIAALDAKDEQAVLGIFGPENDDVVSTGDIEQDRAIWGAFLRNAHELNRIESSGPDRAILVIGRDLWPFPAAILREDGRWYFDADSAREEVLARRIGRNELEVIDILNRAGEVQAAYRRIDHDGDGVKEFAAAILSSPGQRDGLYWPQEPGAAPSPFDATMARASFDGFSEDEQDHAPDPYQGYYFRILQGQGSAAPGGAYSYMVAGNMVAGHALVAYPAVYGDSGIMSFMVGEGGIVYQADLGEQTLAKAAAIESFAPGEGWAVVE